MSLLALGAFLSSLGGPATWATAMDLGGPRAAVVAGVMNMAGNIGAYFCPLHVGKLFSYIDANEASWSLVPWLFVTVYAAACLSWFFVNPLGRGQR
jgi:nitrate/nitrite transporter NarK